MISKKYAILLVFLVVVGGVVSLTWFGGGGEPANTTEPNGTDGSYGVNGTGYSTGDLPRGVTVDMVYPNALVDEHSAKLASSTFTMRISTVETVDGANRTVTTVYKKGEGALYVSKSAEGTVIREEYYDFENGTMHLCDMSQSDTCPTSVVAKNAPGVPTETLRSLFIGGSWSPVDVTDYGSYLKVGLRSTKVSNVSELDEGFGISNVTSLEGQATVDGRQVISRVDTTMAGIRNSKRVEFNYQMTVRAVNQTLVTKPEWVSEASNSHPVARYGISGDHRTMFVKNAEDTAYSSGSTVKVSIDRGETYETVQTRIDDRLDVGDTLYITLVDGELHAYRNKAPDQRGDNLTADAYVVRLIPAGQDAPTTTVEIRPNQ